MPNEDTIALTMRIKYIIRKVKRFAVNSMYQFVCKQKQYIDRNMHDQLNGQ